MKNALVLPEYQELFDHLPTQYSHLYMAIDEQAGGG